MTALQVTAGTRASTTGDVLAVIASLPISLAPAENGRPADLVAVDGGPGWAARAGEALGALGALGAQTRGLLVVHPTPVPPEDVPDASSVPVVVDYRFAGNPALTAAADAFSGWSTDAMVELAAVVPAATDLEVTLVDQLATLRRLGLPVAELTRLSWTGSGCYLHGATTGGSPVLLSAHVTTGAPRRLRVRGLATRSKVELTLPDPGTARPAVLVRTTPSGATTTPTLWETSHRAGWRRLHAAVTGRQPTTDLADLRADLEVFYRALPAR